DQDGLPPPGAGPHDPDLAVARRQGLEPARGSRAIGDHARVRDPALGPRGRRDVVGRAVADAAVEVRADRGVAVAGEPPGALEVEPVPPGHVVDEDDARVWAVALGPRDVGVDQVAITSGVGDDLGGHRLVGIGPEAVPHGTLLLTVICGHYPRE